MKKFIIFLLIGFTIILYMTAIEPSRLVLRTESVFLPNWNKNLNGFKVGVISDMHIGYGKTDLKKVERIVILMNAQRPDLIVLLGDFDAQGISDSKIAPASISSSLKKLKAPYGVIAILGNHDYEPAGIVKKILLDSHITVLENESKYIYPKKQKVRIVGLKDLWHFHPDPATIIGKSDKNIPTIVLEHNPDLFAQMPALVSLTLSGHTHGGEITLPFFGSPTVPSEFGQRYRKGYIVENNKHLFVTSGIGTLSGARFFNAPEIIILKLHPQTPKKKITNTKANKGFKLNYIPHYRSLLRL